MGFWILLQVILDLLVVAGLVAVWLRLNRPAKDDPRMSRGLQLLQTKISILEDLSDRTDTQATQLTALMEHKAKEIQTHMQNADRHVQNIDQAMRRSLEVAKIFQDRIPHQEIVERQNTIKYVKAARLAHQGVPVELIAQQVDLSRGEIEFISKVNRDHLQFSEEDLPDWARSEGGEIPAGVPLGPVAQIGQTAPQMTEQLLAKHEDRTKLSELGDRFRQAISNPQEMARSALNSTLESHGVSAMLPPSTPAQAPLLHYEEGLNSKGEKVQVKRVVFPKVDPNSNLS